jgi:pre-rRNA-processing protein TSR4
VLNGLRTSHKASVSPVLGAQAYAPLRATELSPPGGPDLPERYLYLFACLAPECRNEPDAWRAVRAQRPSAPASTAAATATPPAPPAAAPPVTHWSAAADDWSGAAAGGDSAEGGAQPGGGELQALARDLDAALAVSASEPGGAKPRVAAASPAGASGGTAFQRRPAGGPNSLPEFFVSAEDEPEGDDSNTSRGGRADPKAMPMEAMAAALAGGDGGDGDKGESWAGEAYESTAVRGVPKHYLRFQKRLRRCPEQCVRYGVTSEPMWPTTARPPAWLAAQHQLPAQQQQQRQGGVGSAAPGTTCACCGGFLRVEAQLMAPLIHFFCQGADSGSALSDALLDWEWTTAVLLTCGRVRSRPSADLRVPAACSPA